MARPTKKRLSRLSLVIGFLVGHVCSTAYAFDGEFTLPEQGGENVMFELHAEQTKIDPSAVFKVFVGEQVGCCEGKSPVAGRYSVDRRTVTFIPAFDFIEGQKYTVKLSDEGNTTERAGLFNEFTIGHTVDNVIPEVVAIFPSGNDIPENTLRFYIHFSTPMKPHVSGDFIKLKDASGSPDTAAFMAFKQELWSEDRKRLTLLMDPGRIKRGVAQNVTLGPALEQGKSYSIVVESGWPTANDAQEMPYFERVFTVSEAMRTLPDPRKWVIASPENLTNEPLVIEFDRPFDSELLLSAISVLDDNGRPIEGTMTIEKHERAWRFDRKGIWRNSQIQIVVDAQLEDVAGNNFIELLDHSLGTEASVSSQRKILIELATSPI